MSAAQTKRKDSSLPSGKISKDRLIKFINDDLGYNATNQIKSLVRRREFTKKIEYYNERIKEVLLHEFKKKCYVK